MQLKLPRPLPSKMEASGIGARSSASSACRRADEGEAHDSKTIAPVPRRRYLCPDPMPIVPLPSGRFAILTPPVEDAKRQLASQGGSLDVKIGGATQARDSIGKKHALAPRFRKPSNSTDAKRNNEANFQIVSYQFSKFT